MRRIIPFVGLAAFILTGCVHAERAAGPGTRAAFLALLDRPRVAAEAEERPMPAPPGATGAEVREAGTGTSPAGIPGVVQTHLAFWSEAGQRVPAILVRSARGVAGTRLPVVIVLHGTGSTKESNLALLRTLAARGFLAVAPDGRYHGERCAAGKGTDDYFRAIGQAYRDGRTHPWLYDTVWDVMRLVDYLQTRPDVDPRRIGLMGFSKGGMETYLAAAADERIAAAVPCIGVQSYRWALEHDQWRARVGTIQGGFDAALRQEGLAAADAAFVRKFYARVVPGIDGPFDGPALLPQIAPRPLLVINGDSDALTPVPGLRLAVDAAVRAYGEAGVPERFRFILQEKTGHQVRPAALEQAVGWFERWLGAGVVQAEKGE